LAQLGCYGLAEASLLVSGARWGDPPFLTVDRADLEKGVVTVREPGPGALELVSSGRVQAHHEVRIVDRQTCEEVHDGQVGEIWFRGPSVGAGYWNRTEETTTTFGATLRGDGDRPFLRTGDAGFLHGGQLFVTGRTKDLLIVRGRNLHPEDIEEAAQRSDPRLRPGSAVAFPLQTGEEDAIALLQETTEEDGAALRQLAAGVRRAVTAAVGARVSTIYLVRRRSVLRTSSGKIRRRATQAALEAGRVAVLHVDADTAPSLGMEMA
ncbi:MAG TPA: AMP-binding protein, partial [Actinomycetota bacterium]